MSTSGAADVDEIRHRAYRLWNEDGCPEGRALEYWLRAEAELAAAGGADAAPATTAAESPPQAADEPAATAAARPARGGRARTKAKSADEAQPETAPTETEVAKRHETLVQQRRTRGKAEG